MSKKKWALLVFLTLGFYYFAQIFRSYVVFKAPLPREILLPGLEKSVNVVRDKFGVPHIRAQKRGDLYRALGYVTAKDRLVQLELIRLAAQGRLSEIFGPLTLKMDRILKTLQLEEHFKRLHAQGKLNPEMIQDLSDYTAGINLFLENNPRPLEFAILGHRPEPFHFLNSYAVVGFLAYSFTPALKQDSFFTSLLKKYPREWVEKLRVDPTPPMAMAMNSTSNGIFNLQKLFQENWNPIQQFDGSNAWAVSKERSASGYPLLASDPHVRYSIPPLWYEVHLKLEREMPFEMYSHLLPLIPFGALGHNQQFGWGLTMSYTDDMDLYQEVRTGAGVWFDGRELPITRSEEKLKIRFWFDEKLVIEKSHHGPIVDALIGTQNVSMKWAFLHPENRPLEAFYRMNRAQSLEEFKQGVALGHSPGLNVIYADRSQNIGHYLYGAVPVRPRPYENDFVLDGTGPDEYTHYLAFADKPFAENPLSGHVVSANNRFVKSPSNFRGFWQADHRYQSIVQKIEASEKWDEESFKALQTSTFDLRAKELRDSLLDILKDYRPETPLEIAALNELKNWDGYSRKESIGATLYHSVMLGLSEFILDEWDQAAVEGYGKFQAQWHFISRMLKAPTDPWWDVVSTKPVVETAFDVLRNVFQRTITQLKAEISPKITDWTWGRVHTLTIAHPLGKIPLLGKIFNEGPFAVDGALNSINQIRRLGLFAGHAAGAGPSTRRIIDFAHPEKSWGVLPMGNSGNFNSAYYRDQRDLYLRNQYRPQLMTNFEEDSADKSVLLPAP